MAKTLAKMSAAGREQAAGVAATLGERSRRVFAEAEEAFAREGRDAG